MYLFVLLALLSLQSSVYGQTVSFQADAETGNLSQWMANGGGEAHYALGQTSSGGVYASQQVVHSGKWAFKHDLPDPSMNNEAKLSRWDIDGTTGITAGYYSAWYYIESGYDSGTKWSNIMQWKTDTSETSVDNTFFIYPVTQNGVRQLTLFHWACFFGNNIPCVSLPQYAGSSGWYKQYNPLPVPTRQWFHLEVFYYAARTNGQIIVWQDGTQIYNIWAPNLNTLDSRNLASSLQFGIGGYVDPTYVGSQVIYTDGVMVIADW